MRVYYKTPLMETSSESKTQYLAARNEFVAQWGVLGTSWGINRTMAQIHALLMVSAESLSTDQVMAELEISRGNAHGNLRDLVKWGVVRSVWKKGNRKEYFEAEKDVWKMFCTITKERKRREVEPALEVLGRCAAAAEDADCADCKEFHKQMIQLAEFVEMISNLMDRLSCADKSRAIPLALKFLS